MEYDKTNRLIKYNGAEVKYDKDGNMVYGPLNGVMNGQSMDFITKYDKSQKKTTIEGTKMLLSNIYENIKGVVEAICL